MSYSASAYHPGGGGHANTAAASHHSPSEEMVFDFATKTLIPASTLWRAHEAKAEELTGRAEARMTDLDALLHDLAEAKMITDVREHTVVAKIEDEMETLVHIVRRRAQELAAQVREASRAQHERLEELVAKASAARAELDGMVTAVGAGGNERRSPLMTSSSAAAAAPQPAQSVHVRLDKLFQLEATLGRPLFFDAPPQTLFSVVTKGVDVDQFVGLSKVLVPMRVPASLAVRMTNNAEVAVPFEPSERGPFGVAPGLLHYLGTGGRSTAFTNPFEQGLVAVSGVDFVVGGPLHILRDPTSRESASARPSRTRSERDGKIIFDFGDERCVCLDAYSLQHGHETVHAALRSWNVLGSNDGAAWVVLDSRAGETALGQRPFNTCLFDLTCDADMDLPEFVPPSAAPSRTFYRYIALVITGANASGPGNYHMEVGHVEFYGRIRMGQ